MSHGIAGTERVMFDIGNAIKRGRGEGRADVTLLLPDYDMFRSFTKPLISDGVRVGYFTHRQGKDIDGITQSFSTALRFFRDAKPDVIHLHCPSFRWGIGVVVAANLVKGARRIRTEHNPIMGAPGRSWGNLLRLTDKYMNAFTYVSAGNQKRFEVYLPHRCSRGHVIPNGIDPVLFQPDTTDVERERLRATFQLPSHTQIALCYSSELSGRRSPETVLRAFQKLLTESDSETLAKRWRLMLLGKEYEDVAQLVSTLGIKDYVIMLGYRKDVYKILPNCDLLLSASHFEGMSLTMLEALACGLDIHFHCA